MRVLLTVINSPAGRLARIALGFAMLAAGLTLIAVVAGRDAALFGVLAAAGVVPILLGLCGRCLLEVLPRGDQHSARC